MLKVLLRFTDWFPVIHSQGSSSTWESLPKTNSKDLRGLHPIVQLRNSCPRSAYLRITHHFSSSGCCAANEKISELLATARDQWCSSLVAWTCWVIHAMFSSSLPSTIANSSVPRDAMGPANSHRRRSLWHDDGAPHASRFAPYKGAIMHWCA